MKQETLKKAVRLNEELETINEVQNLLLVDNASNYWKLSGPSGSAVDVFSGILREELGKAILVARERVEKEIEAL